MTNFQSPPCEIGDRVECGGFLGTVKYIGPIDGKAATWLGIDWDDPDRGKHNGTVNGVQYFAARAPTSGSFVRPEKVNCGRTALASIESRYCTNEDEFTAKINQQKHLLIQQTINAPFLEMVGFDKIFNKQSNLSTLRIVNLRDQKVNSTGSHFKLGETCPNIEELDLSKNLFTSWQDILEMCDQLPRLSWLNVSENFLIFPENFEVKQYSNVRTLICGSMQMNWTDVCKVARVFSGLEEFRAPNNSIQNLDLTEGVFEHLKLLDLEGNKIQSWSEVCKLGTLPKLEQLIIENIGLTSIHFEGEQNKVQIFENLTKLCVVNNLIHEWHSIGELNRLQKLEHLKVTKNPIMHLEDHETIHQLIIAKIANLKILNGVEIEPTERRGAEYDYIKKYGLEWLKVKGTEQESEFLKTHNRYFELIEKYGTPEESELATKPKNIKSFLVQLRLIYQEFEVEKKIPLSMTVQKLMVLCQKVFSLRERPYLTYISSTGENIEIQLDDDMREIGFFSMQDGDRIIVSD